MVTRIGFPGTPGVVFPQCNPMFFQRRTPTFVFAFLKPTRFFLKHGRPWQAPTGEIGLSEFRIVFAEVSICPERIELLQKSLRETHFEATATRFEYSMES